MTEKQLELFDGEPLTDREQAIYDFAYGQGHDEGLLEASSEYDYGYSDGHSDGYDEGYDKGYNAASQED